MSQTSKVEPHILKRFQLLKKVGSGAYGHVWKVQQKPNKGIYALKKIFDAFQHATDAQRTYRQVCILRQLDHDNIIKLKQSIKAENGKDIYLVFEYMQADLHNVISQGILKQVHNKYIVYQIAKALKYLHSAHLIHRDLKPSNILLNSNCHVKLCDFGLVRCVTSTQDQKDSVMTEGVATRWYRAPEVLLGSRTYEYAADVWSFGCIIFEIYARRPLFNGSSTLEQLEKIIEFTGYPDPADIAALDSDLARTMIGEVKLQDKKEGNAASVLHDIEPEAQHLIKSIIQFNPKKRMTIEGILAHPLLKDFRKMDEEKICSHEIKTDIDDNKRLSVDNYKSLLYKPSVSESKRQTPPKFRKTIGTNPTVIPKSDKKLSTVLSNNKSAENLKPSSAVLGPKNPATILKANKSSQQLPKPEASSYQPKPKPTTTTASTKPQNNVSSSMNLSKPLKVLSPISNNISLVHSPKASFANISSSKLMKPTLIKKPLEKESTIGLTKTLNVSETLSPKAVLGRRPINPK